MIVHKGNKIHKKYIIGKGFCSCGNNKYSYGKGFLPFKEIGEAIVNAAIIGKNAYSIAKDAKEISKGYDSKPNKKMVDLIEEITASRSGRGFSKI